MLKKIIGLLAITLAVAAPVHAESITDRICTGIAGLAGEAAQARDKGVPMRAAISHALTHPVILNQEMADYVPAMVYDIYTAARKATVSQVMAAVELGCQLEMQRAAHPQYRR